MPDRTATARTLMACALAAAALTIARAEPPGPRAYYIDAGGGSDTAAGTSRGQAWRTLAPLGSARIGPGTRILLRSGGEYAGPLTLRGAGTATRPITVGPYEPGALPRITAASGPVLHLAGAQHCRVRNLELTGGACGVLVESLPEGRTRGLAFERLRIHDIHGGLTGDDGGFLIRRTGPTAAFDDIRIEACTIERADRNGILLTDWPAQPEDPRSTRVVIRGNQLRDIGGDGIFILGCEGAVIERNVLRYAHQRVGRAPGERACAGIWPQRSNRTLIQYNEVSHTAVGGRTVWDSEAFDDDIACRGTIFQYNWSHDNAGGFLLNCGASGTIVRYNISQNDATATFTFESDGARDCLIANNTVYVGAARRVQFARNTFGSPRGIRFTNNLVYADGVVFHDTGRMRDVGFDHCCFFGQQPGMPAGDACTAADPRIARNGGGSDARSTAAAYRLRPGSPCVGAGTALPDDGGRDFFGGRTGGRTRAIGAHQP